MIIWTQKRKSIKIILIGSIFWIYFCSSFRMLLCLCSWTISHRKLYSITGDGWRCWSQIFDHWRKRWMDDDRCWRHELDHWRKRRVVDKVEGTLVERENRGSCRRMSSAVLTGPRSTGLLSARNSRVTRSWWCLKSISAMSRCDEDKNCKLFGRRTMSEKTTTLKCIVTISFIASWIQRTMRLRTSVIVLVMLLMSSWWTYISWPT